MWELDHKEGWVPKNWCFQIVVLGKTLESPLDCKEINAANPKGKQPWVFTGRTDAESKAAVLWPRDANNQLTGKDLMLGKIEGKRLGWLRRWDEVGRSHHRLHGHQSEKTSGESEGQGGLACSCRVVTESDMTLGLNNSNKSFLLLCLWIYPYFPWCLVSPFFFRFVLFCLVWLTQNWIEIIAI